MKCGISTNGIVWPSKITSCSFSQASSFVSSPAQVSPSLESSTRYCSLRLLTWSIRAHRAPSTGALLLSKEGIGAHARGGTRTRTPRRTMDFESMASTNSATRARVRSHRRLHRMGWLFYSLTTVALFTLWSLLGKIALRTATPVQTTLLYGIAAAVVAVAAIAIGQRTAGWSVSTLWIGVLSAACGALGLLTFYLALDRG